ncbi:ABC transporter ATP-binding protein [Streptomyces sp. NPDC052396]|uniref:ABC transporter ATP-binding protein n=1 Tax=Streptomyces sp. NPDC052396 TaxID=3365689 RepID=UPI0037CFF0D2
MSDDMLVPVIDLRGVGLTYPGPPPVAALKPCDMRIERGVYTTIVGPSGSGKSTLLNVLGLLDAPSAGTYHLDGIDTGSASETRRTSLRAARIGFVFQSFHLLPHRSARENVELAMVYQRVPRRDRRLRAGEALERVGLGHKIERLPTRLSGGERQRVAIARALVGEPSLLLCDEPTGNLDSRTAAAILDLLDALHRDGMTIVVITHDSQVAARGQRRISVHDGVLTDVTSALPAS